MTLAELKEKLQAELERGAKYNNVYADTPFASLGASPDYIRGGRDALKGVLKLLEQLENQHG